MTRCEDELLTASAKTHMPPQNPRTGRRPGRKFRQRLLLVFFGLLFGALLCELGLRLIGYAQPNFYVNDPIVGYVLRPGIEGPYQVEGKSYVKINSDGLRDREHSITKPPGTYRIAVLGDSFTEAMHVPLEQTYVSLLEQNPPTCDPFAGKKVEVINFGVSGYGTGPELLTLENKVWKYSPDLVVLLFTTYNDFHDNSHALVERDDVPYFVYRNDELVYDGSFRDTPSYKKRDSAVFRFGRWWRDRLRTVQLADYVQFILRTKVRSWRFPETSPFWSVGDIYHEPRDPKWIEAWRVTEALIARMKTEVAQKQVRFLLVVGANGIQAFPDPAVRQEFMRKIGETTLLYPNQRLGAFAAREKIDFLDLAQPMQVIADQRKVLLHNYNVGIGTGHWNAEGHRVAAQLISERLCRQ